MIYNSALKNGTKQFQGMPPTQRFEYQGCIGRRRNIISEGYFDELDTCDVIYCEPPFPAGIKIFDERAKEKTSSYNDFAQGFRRLWDKIVDKPKLAITNKKGNLAESEGTDPKYVRGQDSEAVGYFTDEAGPDIQHHTGEILYVENITPITRSDDQTERVKLMIKF